MVKRALQLTGPGRFEFVDRPMEPLADDEVLVRVEAVTTCPQWDMHLWQAEPMFPGHPIRYPITPGQPGHEMVGRVIESGGSATLAVGQRVAAWRDAGDSVDGCYATHVARKDDQLLPIPDDMPASDWTPLELAMCVATLMLDLKQHGFLPCRRLGIAGLGPSGLVAVQMARAMGVVDVIGFDLDESRRKLAEQLGCTATFDSTKRDSLPGRRHPDSLDVAIDCVGHRTVFDMLAAQTRDVVALFGVQREAYAFQPDYWSSPPLRIWGYPSHHRKAADFAHQLVRDKKITLRPLVTHQMPLKDYGRAVELLLNHSAIKVCLHCDERDL